MCRFKYNFYKDGNIVEEFQYILCVGSSFTRLKLFIPFVDFNTSYVSVQGETQKKFIIKAI